MISVTEQKSHLSRRGGFQFFWREPETGRNFRSGVSLHSHTMFSEESLGMVPHYTKNVPYLRGAIRRQTERYRSRKESAFDFSDAFWTPPLAPRQAHRLEEKQIQRQFQLPALVSLTDHDDIRAGMRLRVMGQFSGVPISTEWTIPFRGTFFHLGIHNLPAQDAEDVQAALGRFTDSPKEENLPGLLQMLNGFPGVLLILNHPLWDEKGIGQVSHRSILQQMLFTCSVHFHALELNGLRHWRENREVVRLGREIGLPVVSGGDRHGREANAILNLSEATTFADFVQEVRYEHFSHVVFMRQYRDPLRLRILQTMVDVVREYPENGEGRKVWSERVFYREPKTGAVIPLKQIWTDGGPGIVKQFVAAMRLLEWRGVRSALRLALNESLGSCRIDLEAA